MLFHLPGTAAEDMALGAGRPVPACVVEAGDAEFAAIRNGLLEALDGLIPNPLHTGPVAQAAEEPYQLDASDDANED